MKIIVTGSLGNIGKKLTTELLSAGNEVTVVTSNAERQNEIENLGAKAAVGSVSDAEFLARTFEGADAVFAMTPPNLGGQNVVANTTEAGKAFAQAFKTANLKRVVMLSSIGADLPNGNGPIEGLHHIENIYNELEGLNITFLRAGYFYTNFYNDVPMIKNAGIMGSNISPEVKIPLVHPSDVAVAAAEELQKLSEGKNIRYIVSDFRSPAEISAEFGKSIGKPELPWIEFSDDDALNGMTQAGIPTEIAQLYVDMGAGLRSGKISADFEKNDAVVNGKTKLEDFAKEFSKAF